MPRKKASKSAPRIAPPIERGKTAELAQWQVPPFGWSPEQQAAHQEKLMPQSELLLEIAAVEAVYDHAIVALHDVGLKLRRALSRFLAPTAPARPRR